MAIAFPNVRVALITYLTIITSNTEGERSSSGLKRITSKTRSNLAQDKLAGLADLYDGVRHHLEPQLQHNEFSPAYYV